MVLEYLAKKKRFLKRDIRRICREFSKNDHWYEDIKKNIEEIEEITRYYEKNDPKK